MTDGGVPAAPFVVRNGETRGRIENPAAQMRLLAGVDDTAGAMTVFVGELAPGMGPPRHVHDLEHELLFVLAGSVTAEVGDIVTELAAGDSVWMPIGVPHVMANLADRPARVLAVATPGGIERFFNEATDYLGSLEVEAPDPDVLRELGGGRTIGPPLAVERWAAR